MNKKYFIVFLLPVLISLTACQNQQNTMETHHKEAAIKVLQIFDSGNVDELDAIIAENAVDHQLDPSMSTKSGLAGVKEMFSKFHQIFPDMKTTIHSIAVSGDTVFAYTTSEGTPTEPFMGMPANQKTSMSGVDIMRFEGDKIVEHWGFLDVTDMMKMMQSNMPSDTTKMKNE